MDPPTSRSRTVLSLAFFVGLIEIQNEPVVFFFRGVTRCELFSYIFIRRYPRNRCFDHSPETETEEGRNTIRHSRPFEGYSRTPPWSKIVSTSIRSVSLSPPKVTKRYGRDGSRISFRNTLQNGLRRWRALRLRCRNLSKRAASNKFSKLVFDTADHHGESVSISRGEKPNLMHDWFRVGKENFRLPKGGNQRKHCVMTAIAKPLYRLGRQVWKFRYTQMSSSEKFESKVFLCFFFFPIDSIDRWIVLEMVCRNKNAAASVIECPWFSLLDQQCSRPSFNNGNNKTEILIN